MMRLDPMLIWMMDLMRDLNFNSTMMGPRHPSIESFERVIEKETSASASDSAPEDLDSRV